MNKRFRMAIWIVFILSLIPLTNAGAMDPAPVADQDVSAQPVAAGEVMPGMMEKMQNKGMMEMMGQGPGMMDSRPRMDSAAPSARMHMMGGMLSGRMSMDPATMQHMMDREFFLDRAEELGLSDEQVDRLRAIRSACRKDNIRTGAEVKIARMDLDDLLSRRGWTLEEAEKLVRQIQTLEGDMWVRHLLAVTDARKVLTAGQLDKAESGRQGLGMEELFE